jgi:hypothetical protein
MTAHKTTHKIAHKNPRHATEPADRSCLVGGEGIAGVAGAAYCWGQG